MITFATFFAISCKNEQIIFSGYSAGTVTGGRVQIDSLNNKYAVSYDIILSGGSVVVGDYAGAKSYQDQNVIKCLFNLVLTGECPERALSFLSDNVSLNISPTFDQSSNPKFRRVLY